MKKIKVISPEDQNKENFFQDLIWSFSDVFLGESLPLDIYNMHTGEVIVPFRRKINNNFIKKMAKNYENIEIDPSPMRNRIREIIAKCKDKYGIK